MKETILAIIGGSGIYEIEQLEQASWQEVDTAFGQPSDRVLLGRLNGLRMAFLPRHGRGHIHSPSSVPYRANIAALKQLGVTDIISLSAVGSLRSDIAPGDFVIVDQFIDRTTAREKSFFGQGLVAHVSMAKPTCARLGDACELVSQDIDVTIHKGGTYLAMEGPQFSSLAESKMYRTYWGADVIGMTNMPEAKLAREAEICYATVAMVTDYDSWHPDHGEIDITDVIKTLESNTAKAKNLVSALPSVIPAKRTPCPQGCDQSLEFAIITRQENRDPMMIEKLSPIAGRVL
ncbi:MAG: S-methyl-5'-thioadenosine phosphorylase [Aestuariivita sp.]|nr:S-methyl-5'-thioadenosine phosphorylase [Aestuariivita sp.]MCY4346732.1 S-methyl-5'-thioadenosine phosphorylase [Aestuariivita sp.]